MSAGGHCPGGSMFKGSLSRMVAVPESLCQVGSLSRGLSVWGGSRSKGNLCPGGGLYQGDPLPSCEQNDTQV